MINVPSVTSLSLSLSLSACLFVSFPLPPLSLSVSLSHFSLSLPPPLPFACRSALQLSLALHPALHCKEAWCLQNKCLTKYLNANAAKAGGGGGGGQCSSEEKQKQILLTEQAESLRLSESKRVHCSTHKIQINLVVIIVSAAFSHTLITAYRAKYHRYMSCNTLTPTKRNLP